MNRIIMTILLAAGLVFTAAGDDFEDFIQVCARLSTNYNHVIRAKGTRFDKEYQANLEHMKNLSHKIQPVIRRLGIGQDIDFTLMASELEHIYLGNQDQTAKKMNSQKKTPKRVTEKLSSFSESPESLLKVLTADVKALRKMEFTTENGGSIKSSLETKRRLLEFRRLVDFFRQNYAKLYRNSKKDISLERLFQLRMRRMSALSADLMRIARKNNPDTQSKNNLHAETDELMKNYEAWRELKQKSAARNSKGGRRNPKNQKRLDGLNTVSALQTEINVSLRNINDQLVQWEQAGFKTDGFIDKNRKDRADDSDPASVMNKADDKNRNYSAMSEKDLNALLIQRRSEIIKSNRSLDGFDRDAERQFVLTLSREDKRSYNEFLRNFQQQGYSSEQAVRNAVLKTITKLQLEGKPLPARELIRILQALDKDEERRREKNHVEFKLEPARQEK